MEHRVKYDVFALNDSCGGKKNGKKNENSGISLFEHLEGKYSYVYEGMRNR